MIDPGSLHPFTGAPVVFSMKYRIVIWFLLLEKLDWIPLMVLGSNQPWYTDSVGLED